MRSTTQAGALDDGSFPISDATEEGEIQPYNTSDQLCIQERGGGKPFLTPPGSWLELLKHVI